METNLLDRMLSAYMSEQKSVTVTLQNRVRLSGRIQSFDSYVIVMDSQRREIIYRHAVASLAAASADEAKRPSPPQKPDHATTRQKNGKPDRSRSPKPSHAAPIKEASINSSMKEGLLKWMQGRKAAK